MEQTYVANYREPDKGNKLHRHDGILFFSHK